MPLAETGITTDHVVGGLGILLIPVVTTILDHIVQSLFDRKVFEPIWLGLKRRYKAWRTKRNKITSTYEFSIYLDTNLPKEDIRKATEEILNLVDEKSGGDFEILEQKWSADGREIDAEVSYKDTAEPYELTLNFIPDSADPFEAGHASAIGSIGVEVKFRFEFGKLRNSIIDLMLFARFLRDSATDLLSVRSVTDGRFVVSPIDNDLTLDDWIKKEQFDVSLLLESEDGRQSVEFHSNKAVISSPHTEVDDETVEYIRATLLNYYL